MININRQDSLNTKRRIEKVGYMSMLLIALNLQTGCSSEPVDFSKAKVEQVNKIDDEMRKNEEKIRKHQEAIRKLQDENKELQKTKHTRNR
jgi:hypothetical protein